MSIRLLVLGNSSDLIDGGDGRATSMWLMAAAIEHHTRETVELRHVVAFPNPGLARYAAKVVDEFDPDLVCLHCSGWVVGPHKLTYRMQHVLGRRQYALYSRLVAAVQRRIGMRMDQVNAMDSNPGLLPSLYAVARDGLVRAGLGDSLTTVEEATEAYAATIRLLAAREALTVLVRGPMFQTLNDGIARIQAGAEARITALDAALAAQCNVRRVAYCTLLPIMPALRPLILPDGLHMCPEAHAIVAAMELRTMPRYFAGSTGAAG